MAEKAAKGGATRAGNVSARGAANVGASGKMSAAKTKASEAKPKAADAKPKAAGATPKAAGATPKAADAKPKAAGATPKAAGAKPNAGAAKPKVAEAKPKAGEAKPKAADAKLQAGDLGGEKAPAFKLTADDGSTVSLSDFGGKTVVLYFYPKDNTPGCTRQACAFQENLKAISAKGAVVLGVSRDSPKTHAGFKTKYGLAFPLLSDPDASVHKAYGAWGTKTMYGREMTGAIRSTFVIDPKGRIAKRFPNVKVDGHTEKVIEALAAAGTED